MPLKPSLDSIATTRRKWTPRIVTTRSPLGFTTDTRVSALTGATLIAFGFSLLPSGVAHAAKKTTAAPTTTAVANRSAKVSKGNVKAEVESRLASLQQKASPALKVGKATCPSALASVQIKSKKEASKPTVFRCTVLVEGMAAPYDVEIRDGGFQNGGSFLMARAKAIIDIAKVVDGTKLQLDKKDQDTAKISCGPAKVVVAVVGDKITCVVSFAPDSETGGTETLVYEVRDLDGTISLKL